MRRIATAVALAIVSLGSQAQAQGKYDTDPSKWKVIARPSKNDWEDYYGFLRRANYSNHDWVVGTVDGKIAARLAQDVLPENTRSPVFDTTVQLQNTKAQAFKTLKVADGWITAYNAGEFGAAVYWFSDDGKKKTKLSQHHVNQFLIEGDRVFAVEGLAHLGLSRGSMIEIKKAADGWKAVEFLPLPGSAEAIARVGQGDYVVVTSSMLLRVNLSREILLLIPDEDWGGLYPHSIAVADGKVYIGMRQFVGRCELGKSVRSIELLVPNEKWLNTKG